MFQPTLTLTVSNANVALKAGLEAILGGQTEIDLAQLTSVDSAGVATLLAWQRAAQSRHSSLHFLNLPAEVSSLAELYGVSHLLFAETNAKSEKLAQASQ